MKVGTLTFHTFNNYGSILQAYALQKAIESMGFETEVINYRCHYAHTPLSVRALQRKGLVGFLLGIAGPLSRIPRYSAFKKFRKQYLKQSPRVSRNDLESGKVEDWYDLITVGSDVVWNDEVTDFDQTFFLDWVTDSKKKGSYSASFGFSEIPEDLRNRYQELLSSFSYFNIREQTGVEIIENLLNRHANLVLDPTLLLSKEEWDKITLDYSDKGDYIFVYQLVPSRRLVEFAQALSRKTGYPLKFVMFPMGKAAQSTLGFSEGPQEWLSLIKHAKYVVSDSFHGTAFSLIFNKEFYTEIAPSRAGFGSRIQGILDKFGLGGKDGRLITDSSINQLTPIDYNRVNQRMSQLRDSSLSILRQMILNQDD